MSKSNDKRWIFIVEDCSTKWVELFALTNATAKECAVTLIEEVFLRYGLPRRIVSDNGPRFVSAVMQQVCFLLEIKPSLTPVYHPQANLVERKNRDLKPRLAMLVGNDHTTWCEKLPVIRFALNSAKCSSTGQTAAYLMFGREPRTTDDITHDFRSIIENDNFVPEITPYLKKFAKFSQQVKERMEISQDRHKQQADKKLRKAPHLNIGDKVWVKVHPHSQASKNRTSKFMPRRDGPYIISSQRSPVSYTLTATDNSTPIGTYHVSSLTPYRGPEVPPLNPLRTRGRPRKKVPAVQNEPQTVVPLQRPRQNPRERRPAPTRKQPPRKASCCCIPRTTYKA